MKIIIFLSILISCLLDVSGQTIEATTTDGKKVVLKSDGTWSYVKDNPVSDSNSMDCSNLILTETDKVTGKVYTGTKESIIISKDNKNGIAINLLLSSNGNSLIFSISAYGAGNCIDKGDKINILFNDGSRMELLNEKDFNCENSAVVYFGGIFGKKSQLNELKTKKIQTMRVWTKDDYVEEDFPATAQNTLYYSINCLIK